MEGQCLHHKQLAVIQKFLPNSLRNDVMPGPPKNGPDLHGERQGFLAKTFGKHGSALYLGGAKFCNGDTLMARITPCLENGKTAFVDVLKDGEVAFGSTEFIVMRAKKGISDPQFVYYLAISPTFRDVAIKSMVGSSGRQRVQQSVLGELELTIPSLEAQEQISAFLGALDYKIALNNKINDNLAA